MRYLITDDSRHTLLTLDVPADDMLTIAIERADQPELLLVALDLHADGAVHVGHWPDGEDWQSALRTSGVPNAYGPGTPAEPAAAPLLLAPPRTRTWSPTS